MRVFFIVVLALSVLPLSGCAKKKNDDSPGTNTAANPSPDMNNNVDAAAGGGHGTQGHGMDPAMDVATDDPTMEEGMQDAEAVDDSAMGDAVADASQNREFFDEGNPGVDPDAGGHGSGTVPNNPAAGQPNAGGHGAGTQPNAGGHGSGTQPNAGGHGSGTQPNSGGHGSGTQPNVAASTPSAGGHGSGTVPNANAGSTPSAGGHGSGTVPNANAGSTPSAGGHGSGTVPNANAGSTPSAGGHGSGTMPNQPAGGDSGKKGLSGFAQKFAGFFTGDKPPAKGTATPPAAGEHGEAVDPEMMDMDTAVDPAGETATPMPGELAGEGGQPAQTPAKATDIPGVKEGTPEYAAVSLILKVSRGNTEGLDSLIAEDAKGFLADLRTGKNEKALAEAKELMGRVKQINSRLEERDTVIYFQNDKEKILQFHIRKVQGEYVVREVRVRPATTRRR